MLIFKQLKNWFQSFPVERRYFGDAETERNIYRQKKEVYVYQMGREKYI